jgi:hypothetical protein
VYEFGELVPELRPYAEGLLSILGSYGLNPQVTSTKRSYATQKRLYDTYRAGKSRYPAAPPGYSAHEHGWAFDLQLNDSSWLTDAGNLWESWGGTWGGRFSDPIHFELGGASAYLKTLLDQGYTPEPEADPQTAQVAPGWTSVLEPGGGASIIGYALEGAASAGNWIWDETLGRWLPR